MQDSLVSKPRELRPAQKEAAYTLDRHIAVTAGPGSGKTTVLVERYLSILRLKHAAVEHVVAITFTNRAANEMRSRLRKELDRLLNTPDADERRMWLRHKRTLDSAVITTIHGFCSRLLREYPLEAGIDPQFTLLDEHQSAMLEENVVHGVLSERLAAGHEALKQLTLSVGHAALSEAVLSTYRQLRNQGLSCEDAGEATARSHATREDYDKCLEQIEESMAGFIREKGLTSAAEICRKRAEQLWPHFKSAVQEPPMLARAGEFVARLEEFRSATRPRAQGRMKPLVDTLDELVWEKDCGGRLPQICFDIFAKEFALEILELVQSVEERLNREKDHLSAMSFDDLQIRTLDLLRNREDVRRRVADRFRYFLVDEFQDTNGLQQELVRLLALSSTRSSNLFIVGDPKQSIYGFRGADVGVFKLISDWIEAAGGERKPLHLNFRSQPQLVAFFNELFRRVFTCTELEDEELSQLGYVPHEEGIPERETVDSCPLVELHLDVRPSEAENGSPRFTRSSRERDAAQVATRIRELVNIAVADGETAEGESERRFRYKEIALLFRAMSEVGVYEAAFRRAGIPYRTVAGRGFYQREEVTDLIQLLRFLDNTTDELALASVLRSPLCCLSDNTLMALRCAPLATTVEGDELAMRDGVRPLWQAVRLHQRVDLIEPEQRAVLDRTREFLSELVRWRRRLGIAEILRRTIGNSEYLPVIAANHDGALRVANVEKLVSLAERFERSGAHTVRDFVRFVDDFARRGGRESEGTLDESMDAVTLMTIHQSKGLEFSVVILPELHRVQRSKSDWYLLDRHMGLTLKAPDGRGRAVAGRALATFRERAVLRERFESMRLLYVAATRAQDRLILTGSTADLVKLNNSDDNWLSWVWQALAEGKELSESCELLLNDARVRLVVSSVSDMPAAGPTNAKSSVPEEWNSGRPIEDCFPLLQPLAVEQSGALNRYNVTELSTFRQCPRQYYFRYKALAPEQVEVSAESFEAGAHDPFSFSALAKGAVIHRFCEKFERGDDVEECLQTSLQEVLILNQHFAGLVTANNMSAVVKSMVSLARSFASSAVFERIERARRVNAEEDGIAAPGAIGAEAETVFSERKFLLRCAEALVSGTVDKLLVIQGAGGESTFEVIDFKTDRIRSNNGDEAGGVKIEEELRSLSERYRLQMQAYALAVYQTEPGLTKVSATLHYLDKDREYKLEPENLTLSACRAAVDSAIREMISAVDYEDFGARTGVHCRHCGYLKICSPGRAGLIEDPDAASPVGITTL
jgi:ATP-dependent helicase/nuclease subunit A